MPMNFGPPVMGVASGEAPLVAVDGIARVSFETLQCESFEGAAKAAVALRQTVKNESANIVERVKASRYRG